MGIRGPKKGKGGVWQDKVPRVNPNKRGGWGTNFKSAVSIVHITARSATRDHVGQKGFRPRGGVEVWRITTQ